VKFLGQFLLEKGLINKDQLLAALDAQRASNRCSVNWPRRAAG
jgi:hypothetical protein